MNAFKTLSLVVLMLAALAAPLGVAADDDNPTLAFLRFGQSPAFELTDAGVLDVLQAYGYISAEERASLESGGDLHGERINLLYRDAGFDFATASLMVEDALDEGADVFLTVSTQVGMIAAGAMSDLEEPPALIFAIVTDATSAGLAMAPCVKPPNITGTLMDIDYNEYTQLAYLQTPNFSSVGFLVNADDPASDVYIAAVDGLAQQMGFTVEYATVVTPADYAIATETLVDKGVDYIALFPRTGSSAGIASIVDVAWGVPVYSPLVSDAMHGVTIGAGFEGWYREGVQAARMAVAYLEGAIDIATTGIATTPSFAIAVNLDSAEIQGIEITEALLAEAHHVIEGGAGTGLDIEVLGQVSLEEMSIEERRAEDAAWLESLQCTPEMIADQIAALTAAQSG